MTVYLKLAWRNIWRNRRRTYITLFAMSLTLALMIAYSGLVWGLFNQMERNATLLGPGEIQIHRPGYLDDRSIYRTIDSPETVIAVLEKGGARAAPRLQGFGLSSRKENSLGTQILGIDPRREKEITTFYKHLAYGTFIDEPGDVVLGSKVAAGLDAAVGDELVVVTQAADGSIGNDLYRVTGVFKSISEEIDRSTIMMSLDDFRQLFGMGNVATEITVRRNSTTDNLDQLRDRIQAALPELEVKTWRELFPAISDMIDLADVSIYILYVIVYFAAALITLNTMLMSVFERIKELGIMMAIGLRPLQIFTLILTETIFLTLCSIAVGLTVGTAGSLYLTRHGLDLSVFTDGFTFAGIVAEAHWFAVTTPETVLPPIVFIFIISLLSVLYPAAKACRLKPVDALVFQ